MSYDSRMICLAYSSILLIIFVIFAVIFKFIPDLANESRCYQLSPYEFYKDSSCEKYWNDEK